jgi:peptidoglycan hydrolase CwlO-like protein
MNHRSKIALATLTALLVAHLPSPASAAPLDNGSSLQEMQRARDEVRSKKAVQATQVNALEASDAEVTEALNALNEEVRVQQDRVEEAERALEQAEADRAAAEKAQADAQAQLDALSGDIKRSAVEAFVNIGSTDPISTVGTDDVNVAVNKRMLLDVRATESLDLVEKFRSIQEDLELQRAAKADAEQRAVVQRDEVTARKAELDASLEKQKTLADAVEERLNSALAEAASLQSLDQNLSQQIEAKQAEIARAIAAQRAAEAARAAQRAAAEKAALASNSSGGAASSGGGGGGEDNSVPPSITGSGEIVTVGGIQVHQSIAGNIQALLSAAAADGIHFGGGGFRSPAGQIAVRRSNCGGSNYAIYHAPASSCSPPTARPGSSMHERGLAIDFTQGGSTLTRGSSGFQWLKAHGGAYGMKNLPSEPWHWSTTGQ